MAAEPTAPLKLRTAAHRARTDDVRAVLAAAALTPSPEEERTRARAFCQAAVAAWWQARHGGASAPVPCPLPLPMLDPGVLRHAAATGEDLAGHSHELAAYLLSTLYAGLLPDEERSAGGVYFTPPALVERLLHMAEAAGARWEEHRVLDPAAGAGAFLVPVAKRMAAVLAARGASAPHILHHVAAHLRGVELDPFSAWMAHVFLEASLWEHCTAAGERLPPLVRVQDALALPDGWEGGYDLVVGNPPYGRVTLEPETRRRYARALYGHANLYGVFTDLSIRLSRPGGRVALVTPASFLGGQYFKQLRTLLLREAPPVAIDFVTDRAGVFDAVLQETVLVLFSRTQRAAHPPVVAVRSVRPSSLSAPCRVVEVGQVDLSADGGAPWILPRTPADAALLDRVSAMPHRLADYGLRVSTGPLVWNRHKGQLSGERGDGCYPLVWAESVLPEGEFRFRSERRNHLPYFRLLHGQAHLLVRTPVVLLQRTTAKEQTRRLVAALLPQAFLAEHGGAVVENHLNMVRPTGVRARVPLDAVAALLNSRIVDAIFRCTSGSVAVSAYELESIPVPPPEAMHQLHALIEGRTVPAAVEAFLARWYGHATEAAA